jgi:hypothetical protein
MVGSPGRDIWEDEGRIVLHYDWNNDLWLCRLMQMLGKTTRKSPRQKAEDVSVLRSRAKRGRPADAKGWNA